MRKILHFMILNDTIEKQKYILFYVNLIDNLFYIPKKSINYYLQVEKQLNIGISHITNQRIMNAQIRNILI